MAAADDTKTGFSVSLLQGVLPISSAQIPAELAAGITLAALAIPEVMGYTKIAGTPVITGLYTLLIPTVLFAVFGSSRHLVVGADSATAAILSAGLVGLAASGSDEYLALAAVLALMAAAFLFLARTIGLGFMADFLSRTVLVGFLTGVGLQVALGQVSGMLGLQGGGHGTLQKIWNDLQQLEQLNGWALGVAIVVLIVMVGAKQISPKIPGALIAVVGSLVASWALNLESRVPVLGAVPSGIPKLGLPQVDVSLDLIGSLVPTAFAMFVVILAQSAATSRAYAAKYKEQFSENTDLIGLAMANLGAGLSGTFVVNGSPTKTQMVDSAGGRSQLSLILTAVIVLLVLLFLTKPLAYMPECVLSAVVFLIGVELVNLKGMRKIFVQRRSEFWVALITTVTVLLVGVEQGILLAIALSLIDHTRHGYRPRTFVLIPTESDAWQPQPLSTASQALPGLVVYRFTHSLYYANSQQLEEDILGLVDAADPPLRRLCIEASAIDDIDYTAAETLRSLIEILGSKNIDLVMCHTPEELRSGEGHGLADLFAKITFYETLSAMTNDYQRLTDAAAT
jgi:high affinity sulfate transporter 1